MENTLTTLNLDDQRFDPEFLDLVERCHTGNPGPKVIKELREWLKENPELYKSVFDLSKMVQDTIVSKITEQKVADLSLRSNLEDMRQSLGWEQSPAIERLLIENILNNWLRCQWVDYWLASFMGKQDVRFVELEFWEKRLSATQRRYLRAIETLARIRRMALPAVQVNINTDSGQQLNVAGNLEYSKKRDTKKD